MGARFTIRDYPVRGLAAADYIEKHRREPAA
jgi:hypothetical protein